MESNEWLSVTHTYVAPSAAKNIIPSNHTGISCFKALVTHQYATSGLARSTARSGVRYAYSSEAKSGAPTKDDDDAPPPPMVNAASDTACAHSGKDDDATTNAEIAMSVVVRVNACRRVGVAFKSSSTSKSASIGSTTARPTIPHERRREATPTRKYDDDDDETGTREHEHEHSDDLVVVPMRAIIIIIIFNKFVQQCDARRHKHTRRTDDGVDAD